MRGVRLIRSLAALAAVTLAFTPRFASAQALDSPPPALPPPAPAAPPALPPPPTAPPALTGEAVPPPPGFQETPRTPAWAAAYDEARAKLIAGDFRDATARFEELEATATNTTDRALARDQRLLASEWWTRGLMLSQKREGAPPDKDLRTTDELVSLYTSSVFYGIGTGVWLAVLTEPKTAAAGVLPTLGLAAAGVGGVVALDSGGGMKYGMPQAIVSGLYMGLEHGIAWTVWGNSDATRSWPASSAATLVWGSATAGAVAGGVIGYAFPTTPGRASFVGSSSLWSGLVFGLGAGAVLPPDASRHAVAVGAAGLTVGAIAGALLAGPVSPTIARARFLDLGGISGGVVAGGLFLAASNGKGDARAGVGVTALGIGGGLAAAWLLTTGLVDRPGFREEGADKRASRLQPILSPIDRGGVVGLGGQW